MNENLIFEGNTIYEVDPDCMQARKNQDGNGIKEGMASRRMISHSQAWKEKEKSCTDRDFLLCLLILSGCKKAGR